MKNLLFIFVFFSSSLNAEVDFHFFPDSVVQSYKGGYKTKVSCSRGSKGSYHCLFYYGENLEEKASFSPSEIGYDYIDYDHFFSGSIEKGDIYLDFEVPCSDEDRLFVPSGWDEFYIKCNIKYELKGGEMRPDLTRITYLKDADEKPVDRILGK